jgi:hypothetical protein
MEYVEIHVTVERDGNPFHRRTLEARLTTFDVPPTEAIGMFLLPDMVVALRALASEVEERLPESRVFGRAHIMAEPSVNFKLTDI